MVNSVKPTNFHKLGLNIGGIFKKWRDKFQENGIPEPRESTEHILSHCLGTNNVSEVYKNQQQMLSEQQIKRINLLCTKRLKRLPVQYIIGEWDFRYLNLKMQPPVFIPRPETEQLVEIVAREVVARKCEHIVDLCCGTGAIGLSLLQEVSSVE